MTQDMNTTYRQDICNYGAGTLRNCGEGFGGRKAVVALKKGFGHFFRFVAMLILMFVGVNGMCEQDSKNGLALIEKWLRNKNTIEFLGIWESMYNPDFNSPEFEGITTTTGRNGGTYAITDASTYRRRRT